MIIMFTVCITMCTTVCTCAVVLQYSCNGRDRTDIDCYQKNSTAIVVLHTKSKMFPSANVEKQLISMLVVEQFTLHCLAKCVLQLGTYGQCALLRFSSFARIANCKIGSTIQQLWSFWKNSKIANTFNHQKIAHIPLYLKKGEMVGHIG